MIALALITLYFANMIYSLRCRLNLRIAEYNDGNFYIEAESYLIPFFYHRCLDMSHDGDMERDMGATVPSYSSKEEALERINQYHEYCDSQNNSATRKKIYKITVE